MKCLVVDDDPLTCDTVESFLQRIGGVDYCLKVHDGATALHLLAADSFDVVFLDLQLPGLDGVSLLKALPGQTAVIVISASPDFAAESYGFGVIDYLVKPIEFERFAQSIGKLKHSRSTAITGSSDPSEEALFLRNGGVIQRIEFSSLAYIEAQSNYSLFVFDDGHSVMGLVSLRKLENKLPPDFIRIHRSYIINRKQILHIEGSRLNLGESVLPIGGSYRDGLLDALKVVN